MKSFLRRLFGLVLVAAFAAAFPFHGWAHDAETTPCSATFQGKAVVPAVDAAVLRYEPFVSPAPDPRASSTPSVSASGAARPRAPPSAS